MNEGSLRATPNIVRLLALASTWTAAQTHTANITLNDSVTLGFGTSDGESTIQSDGSNTILNAANGQFRVADGDVWAWGTTGDIAAAHSGAVNANTAITGILVGTPVTPVAIAADSLVLGNITASGDILLAVNKGGTSHMAFMADASTGDTLVGVPTGQSFDVYIAGTKEIDYAVNALAFTKATTISTAATTLTLDPATDVLIPNGKGQTIGHTGPLTTPYASELQVLGTANDDASIQIGEFSADLASPILSMVKGRGAIGAATKIVTGDPLGRIVFAGADDSDLQTVAAEIRVLSSGTIATSKIPTNLIFMTAAGAAADDVAEKWRVGPVGVLTSLGAVPTNVNVAGAVISGGGIAFTDVLNAWIDDASHGTGTTTLYVGNAAILTGNGVNFGPAGVTSITVVNGQITAIS